MALWTPLLLKLLTEPRFRYLCSKVPPNAWITSSLFVRNGSFHHLQVLTNLSFPIPCHAFAARFLSFFLSPHLSFCLRKNSVPTRIKLPLPSFFLTISSTISPPPAGLLFPTLLTFPPAPTAQGAWNQIKSEYLIGFEPSYLLSPFTFLPLSLVCYLFCHSQGFVNTPPLRISFALGSPLRCLSNMRSQTSIFIVFSHPLRTQLSFGHPQPHLLVSGRLPRSLCPLSWTDVLPLPGVLPPAPALQEAFSAAFPGFPKPTPPPR